MNELWGAYGEYFLLLIVLAFIIGAIIGEIVRWCDNKQKGKDEK